MIKRRVVSLIAGALIFSAAGAALPPPEVPVPRIAAVESHTVDRRTTASWFTGSFGGCGVALTGPYVATRYGGCGDTFVVVTKQGDKRKVIVKDRCSCGFDLKKQVAFRLGIYGVERVAIAKFHEGWRQENSWAARYIRR